MKVDDGRSLEATIDSALASPTIASLGSAAHATLEAIAAFPGGVKMMRVGSMFPAIGDVAEVIDVLCKFYLLDRHDGTVRMMSPLRFHFMERTSFVIYAQESHEDIVVQEEDVRCNEACGVSPVFNAAPIGGTNRSYPIIARQERSIRGGLVEPRPIAGHTAGRSDGHQNNLVNRHDVNQASRRRRAIRKYLEKMCVGVGKSFDVELDPPVGRPNTPDIAQSSRERTPDPYQL